MSDLQRTSTLHSGRPQRRLAAAAASTAAICAGALWLALSSASGATSSATVTKVFNSTGSEQTFKVPDGVTSINVIAIGGKGGDGGASGGAGGIGARVSANLSVTPGQVLFVNVGGNGSLVVAGFNNGGGLGGNNGTGGQQPGGGGGGATDIRTNSRALVGNTLVTRLVTAGGGGGGGGRSGDLISIGGAAGFAGSSSIVPAGSGTGGSQGQGAAGGTGGQGATPTAGGGNGQFGQGGGGGASAAGVLGGGGGGGGGGIFGGGGGVNGSGGDSAGGGAGAGSSGFGDTAKNTSISPDTTGVPQLRITYDSNETGNKSGLKFGKIIRNKNKGTALLPVTVPGSGELSIGGKGVVKKRPGAGSLAYRLLKEVPDAGTYKLKVKAKGGKLDKLEDTGKVKVRAVVTFAPTSGDSVSASKKIKLKEN